MKSDTPRTDDEQFGATGRVSVDFARTLERELNAARTQLAAVRPLAQQCAEWHIGDGDECGIVARKLLALLEEEKIAELESAPTPLPRPDKPGWWWVWTNEGTPPRWLPVHVVIPEASKEGQWLPATPPPPPKTKEGQP